MKRILTALGNSTLNNELKKYSKYDVLTEDLFYQEALLDLIKLETVDVIVVSSLLQGQYGMVDFLKEVKKSAITSRIILIVDSVSEEDKNILISKGIFDILYDSQIEISDVVDAIDREEPINIKKQLEKELLTERILREQTLKEKSEEFIARSEPIVKIQKQEVIVVFGTPGAGKSTVIANLVKVFSKKTKAKILLIDLDTLSGNLDEILGVSKVPENVEILIDEDKKCSINYIADLVSKNRFDANVLDELIIDCGGFDLVSGNTSLHYCQNVLNENCYNKLIEAAKEKYDFIFMDINSNIFLDSTKWALQEANRVLFVTENSNISLKKSVQMFEVIFNLWNVWKNKIQIVLNKTTSSSFEEDVYTEVTSLKVIGNIKQNQQEVMESYDRILETLEYIPRKTLIDRLNSGKKIIGNIIKNRQMISEKNSQKIIAAKSVQYN